MASFLLPQSTCQAKHGDGEGLEMPSAAPICSFLHSANIESSGTHGMLCKGLLYRFWQMRPLQSSCSNNIFADLKFSKSTCPFQAATGRHPLPKQECKTRTSRTWGGGGLSCPGVCCKLFRVRVLVAPQPIPGYAG